MAETLTDKLKLSKRDTGDINWGQGANANLDAVDAHAQQATLRPPRTLSASLGSGAVGANLSGNATYFYKITAINAVGETTEGKIPTVLEAQVTESASPVPVLLSWETVKGATGYKIYRSTSSGQEKFLASVSGESTAIYTDDGNTAPNGSLSVPSSNTARTSVSKIVAGTNVTISPSDGTGDVTINVGSGSPSGSAGGDLSGTYPNPAVAKVNGTSVPASPSSGQVLTATGPTAATWQTPTGGYVATVTVATPTGVAATDTAAINAAITALPAGGGRVLLREGTYAVNTGIVIPASKPIWIMGQGKGTILQPASTTGNIFDIFKGPASGNIDGLTFSDFHIDGSVSPGIGVVDLQPVTGQTFDKIKVQRVTLQNGGRIVNILATTGTGKVINVAVLDCVTIDPQANGGIIFCNVAATGNASKIIVANNHAKQEATIGVPLLQISGNDYLIENNYLEQPGGSIGDGIISFIGTTTKSAIVGNVFVGASAVGTGSSATISDCAFSSNVADTLVAFVNSFAFQSTTISNCTITGNKCAFPINLGASSSNNVVVGNKATISGGAASDNLVGNGSNTFNAVAVGNTAPTTGQVLTATSPTAAAWQTPAGGYAATVVVAAPSGVAATDTANVLAALTAANAAGGGIVLLREGTYLINSTLTLGTNVSIVGQGKNATTLQATTSVGATALIAMPNSESGLRHLCLDFNGATRGGNTVSDITVSGSNTFLDSIRTTRPNSTGTGLTAFLANTVAASAGAMVCINCEFNFNDKRAAFYFAITNGSFLGCSFNISALSFSLMTDGAASSNVNVKGCSIVITTLNGISSLFQTNFASQWVISDNAFWITAGASGTATGIDMNQPSNRASVTGNIANSTLCGAIGGSALTTISGNAGFNGYTGNGGTATASTRVGNDTLTFNGVAVSPTAPTTGQVLTATGAAAASWQTPAGGGGYATVVVAAPTGVAATDTANIQNAINGISSGTVILREGLYVVNATIALKDRITIRGQGKGEFGSGAPTTIKCDNAMGDIPLFDDGASAKKDVSLEDFSIDFNGFTRAARSGNYDIRLLGIRARLLRIALANTSGINTPILIQCNNITEFDSPLVAECIFIQGKVCANQAFSITGKVMNCTFIGNTATGGFQSGLARFGQPSVVTGCVFRTSVDYTTGVSGSTVSCNTAASNGRAGSAITGCMFIQESSTATRALQVENDGTGAVAIAGNFSATGTNVGSVSVRNGGGSGKVTISGNTGFASYSGGTLSGNDGQTPVNSGDAAGGDLSGTYPNPTVVKVNGTSVPAAPSAGQVLTATGPTAATWQAPASGGYATVVVAAPTGVAATDTANIQAALNSIPIAIGGAGGGVVILRQGVYVVNQLTIFNDGTKITGSGPGFTTNRDSSPGSSLQAANPLSADMLVILASQVMVENISFKGFGLAAGFALVSGNLGNVIFRDCAFVDIKSGNIGIKATTGQKLKILDCMFQLDESAAQTVARTPICIKVGAAGGGFSQSVDIIGNHFMLSTVAPTGAGSVTGKAIEMTKVFKAVIERNQIEGVSGAVVAGVTMIGVELFTDGSASAKGVVIGNNSGRRLNNFIRQATAFPKVSVAGNNYIDHIGTAPVVDLVSGNTNWTIAGNVIEGATGVNLAAGADSNVVADNIANVVNAGAGNSVVNNVAPI